MKEEFSWFTAFVVFWTYVVIDVLYALYVIHVGKRNAFLSASLTAAMYGLLAFGVLSYSKNVAYLVPLVLGAFVGTYFTVLFSKDKS